MMFSIFLFCLVLNLNFLDFFFLIGFCFVLLLVLDLLCLNKGCFVLLLGVMRFVVDVLVLEMVELVELDLIMGWVLSWFIGNEVW